MCARWLGQWYSRAGIRTNSHKNIVSYRNRHTGIIKAGSPKGRILGVEKTHSHFSGFDPRKIPARLKRR